MPLPHTHLVGLDYSQALPLLWVTILSLLVWAGSPIFPWLCILLLQNVALPGVSWEQVLAASLVGVSRQ